MGFPLDHQPPIATVECAFSEVGRVEIVRVTSSALSALWRGMMDAHHYLKSGPLCGAQLRYLMQSERYGWIGGLSYSACARRVESRDAWIGATPAQRALAASRGVGRAGPSPPAEVEGLEWMLLTTVAITHKRFPPQTLFCQS